MVGTTPTLDVRRSIDRRAAIEMIPAAWYRPTPLLYWTDLLVCSSIGWASLAALLQARGGLRPLFAFIAIFALYRATLFIHELAHVDSSALPYFELVWNAVVGVPFLIPSFLYQGVHLDHHRGSSYGTRRDPEYLPFAHRPPSAIGLYLLGALFFPVVVVVRFALLAPASWMNMRIRLMTMEHYSALAINPDYVRRAPPDSRWRLQEFGCAALCWAALIAWCVGWLPGRVLLWWGGVGTAMSMLNAIRALAAHRYANNGDELTSSEQLLDSCTLRSQSPAVLKQLVSVWQVLWAPVGLRYHALHHWIPALPYHSLGKAHRLLLVAIEDSDSYRATFSYGIGPVIADLVNRSRRRRA